MTADSGSKFTIFELYLATAEKVTDRRALANSWMLSVNSAIVALYGYLQSDKIATQSLLGVAIGRLGRLRRIQYEQRYFRREHLHGSKTPETSGRGAGARAASIRARRSLGSFRRSGDHPQAAPSALLLSLIEIIWQNRAIFCSVTRVVEVGNFHRFAPSVPSRNAYRAI